MLSLTGPLTLPDDVLLIPVADLPDETREQLACDPADVAVSRLQGRTGSRIVDAEAADLLARFRSPRTLVEAVILFGRVRQIDPETVLEEAYPFLRGMVESGFLVPAGDDEDAGAAASGAPRFPAGSELPPPLAGRVERTLQLLDDTEVALLAAPAGARPEIRPEVSPIVRSVVKIERPLRGAGARHLVERFRREAAFLAHLNGAGTPALLGQGEIDGRAYLEMAYCPGVDAATAAAEWRERPGGTGRPELLALCRRIAGAYAGLHRRGVLHGDVHPRNVLVDAAGAVWLLDFGVARALDGAPGLPTSADRGGIPFFYEPEFAAAQLAGSPPPPASEAGEQHAVAALLYFLVTGAHWFDFSLGKEGMLRELATAEPLAFTQRKIAAWPALEEVLLRGLAKQPAARFASLADFAAALDRVEVPPGTATDPAPADHDAALGRLIDHALAAAGPDGPWLAAGLSPAPTLSVTYGAAGLALGLLQIAQRRGDARLLAQADLWARRTAREIAAAGEAGFYNSDIQITPDVVGEGSPYHSPSGVHAVAALIARAQGDVGTQAAATAAFLAAAERPVVGLDLTLGRASTLLGAALLLDAVPASRHFDPAPLRAFGDAALAAIWQQLDAKPEIAQSDVEYLGIAHGWAGFLYATLVWCEVAGTALPAAVERRLDELAAFALAAGRGLQWAWVLGRPGEAPTMPGWCNGSCGYVFLWTLAHRRLGHACYLELARGAAWESWDSPEAASTACCGLAGRGWALLNLYRHTGETVWLERARALARRAAQAGKTAGDYPHSLYKGDFGLAVLAADLERPEESAMPFFEVAGYGGPAGRRGRGGTLPA